MATKNSNFDFQRFVGPSQSDDAHKSSGDCANRLLRVITFSSASAVAVVVLNHRN
jgi:hypothetical protein